MMNLPSNQQPGSYTYAESPKAVANSAGNTLKNGGRQKFRDPFQAAEMQTKTFANVMWDRRVYRGNTYAAQIIPLALQQETEMKKKDQDKRRKQMKEKSVAQEQIDENQEPQGNDLVPPVSGRKHMTIQTDQYLEEISDRVVENDAVTQTDAFLDRPESPQFMPAKTGVDKETQIEEDLFDFDFEVEPLLEVLVGKVFEQSHLEVMEEEEMENIRRHQEEFNRLRNAELQIVQRLEAEEERRFQEKERRKKQEQERLNAEQAAKEKLASRAFAKNFLANLETKVFAGLEKEGYFYDVVEREVETDFMPWLVEKTQQYVEKKKQLRAQVDDVLKKALKQMLLNKEQSSKQQMEEM